MALRGLSRCNPFVTTDEAALHSPVISSLKGYSKHINRKRHMTASALQLNLLSKGVFMVDAGTYATKLGNPRFTISRPGPYGTDRFQFGTLAQVKAWVKESKI